MQGRRTAQARLAATEVGVGAGGNGGSGESGSFDASTAADGTRAEVGGADTDRGVDATIDAGVPADPACAAADRNGFFGNCSACRNPADCDAISTSSGTRQACGCGSAADCPCGFRCGSYQIAPGLTVSGICVR